MSSPEPRPRETREEIERTWLQRIRAGDERAFEALFRAYVEPLCAFAYGYVQSQSAAQDIVQDLFARLWEQRATLEPPRSVQSYLYGATRNRALNHQRRARIEVAFVRRGREVALAAPPPRVTPEDDLHAQAFAEAVTRAVTQLPTRCREVFTLTRDHQLSYDEAAQVLGISPKTVEIHVGRALALLRDKLRDWLA